MNDRPYRVFIRRTTPGEGIAFWSTIGVDEDLPQTLPTRREGVGINHGTMDYPTAAEMCRIQWNYKHQPHLGFIPASGCFQGPIWGRFKGNVKTFKAAIKLKRNGKWEFDPVIAASWRRLELALVPLIKLIRDPKLPRNIQAPLRPADTVFWKEKDSAQRALGSVLFAQKLFLEMAGELAYAVATSGHSKLGWISHVLRSQEASGLFYPENWLNQRSISSIRLALAMSSTPNSFDIQRTSRIMRPTARLASFRSQLLPLFQTSTRLSWSTRT